MNLQNRDFLKLIDFSSKEIEYLLDLSIQLKQAKKDGTEIPTMKNKNIALIFQKDSTRTRCAFEVASYDQGAHVTYLGPSGSHFGTKESVADTAQFLSSIYDGIEFRGNEHSIVEELAEYSHVPVWNGLTDSWHPTQMLADYLTIKEELGKIKGINFCYLGDARNNVANSYVIIAAKLGVNMKIGAPKELWPGKEIIHMAEELNIQSGGTLELTEDPILATNNADVITTDVWVSMGEDISVWKERIELLQPYQVNTSLIKHANKNFIFLHCLPAFHDLDTKVAKEIYEQFGIGSDGLEVTDEVFKSQHSVVFKQAENRMHTIKAVMVATIGE